MTTLPDVVLRYQDAHDRREADAALTAFAPDAVVRDNGHEYRGLAQIYDWLSRASVEFSYTGTVRDIVATDATTWVVTNHLEGDFPGGVVDLHYRFVVAGGFIRELDISP